LISIVNIPSLWSPENKTKREAGAVITTYGTCNKVMLSRSQ
jgi:hypothetical protein